MKKMSDVFEFPITHQDDECGTTGSIYQGDNELVLQAQDVKEFAYCSNSERKERRNLKAIYVAHAINHVDALVEALELLLNDKAMIHVSNEKHLQAKAVLAAYRGGL